MTCHTGYSPSSRGEICFELSDHREYSLSCLTEENFLFSGSLSRNLLESLPSHKVSPTCMFIAMLILKVNRNQTRQESCACMKWNEWNSCSSHCSVFLYWLSESECTAVCVLAPSAHSSLSLDRPHGFPGPAVCICSAAEVTWFRSTQITGNYTII